MNTHTSMCNEENLDGFWEIYVCIYRGDITVAVINYKSKFNTKIMHDLFV